MASTGQLVAPSGLLLELLFSTLGGYWGPLGAKLQKHKVVAKSAFVWVICRLAGILSEVVSCCAFLDNY